MTDKYLTDTFQFIAFPKPIKKVKVPKYLRRTVKKAGKRKKLPSISSLKKKADNLFSLFIRERDKRCVIGGGKCRGSLQCGHLIKRGKMATRYDEVNCNCLCEYHNYLDNFDHDIYVSWFLRNYGALMYQDLVERSRGIRQMKRLDFMDIISKYGKV